jgi:hypothetical protein
MADLQLRILGEDAASSAFTSVSSAARSAQQVLVDFARASVRSYMEAERSQRQLAVVAKEMTGAFQAQASALAQANAVSGELVESIQTLLLRYGAAPKDVQATTQAVLDFAAATGTDARAAAEALTRGVETGSGAVKGLGIAFKATGERTEDLRRAVDALGKKFGGAGAADAESLAGQVRLAEDAFGDVQKAFGGFIAEVAQKSGALSAVTGLLKSFLEEVQSVNRFLGAGGFDAMVGAAKAFVSGDDGAMSAARLRLAQAQAGGVLAEVGVGLQSQAGARALAAGGAGRSGRVAGGGGAAGGGVMDMSRFEIDLTPEGPEAPSGAQWQQMAEAQRAAERQMAESHAKSLEDYLKATREAASKLAAEQARFAQAGAQVGAAFADAVSQGIQALASGGEQDAGQVVANILAGLLQTLGTIVGNVLLPGIGGALGGAIGGLAGAGVRAAAAGPTVNINTFDSRNTREFFEADGGRGFYNAQRTGRGQGGR